MSENENDLVLARKHAGFKCVYTSLCKISLGQPDPL